MSRRRSKDPTKAISLTLPESLLDKIHDELTRTSSRSNWIAGACRMRLDDSSSSMEIPTKQLMAMLHSRDDINGEMRGILHYWITTFSSPSEDS